MASSKPRLADRRRQRRAQRSEIGDPTVPVLPLSAAAPPPPVAPVARPVNLAGGDARATATQEQPMESVEPLKAVEAVTAEDTGAQATAEPEAESETRVEASAMGGESSGAPAAEALAESAAPAAPIAAAFPSMEPLPPAVAVIPTQRPKGVATASDKTQVKPVGVPEWWAPLAAGAAMPTRKDWAMPDVEPGPVTANHVRKQRVGASIEPVAPEEPLVYPLTTGPIGGKFAPEEPLWAVWLGPDHDVTALRDLALAGDSRFVSLTFLHTWGGGWLGVMTQSCAEEVARVHGWTIKASGPGRAKRVAWESSPTIARADRATGHVTAWAYTWLGMNGLLYPTRTAEVESLPSKWPIEEALAAWVNA